MSRLRALKFLNNASYNVQREMKMQRLSYQLFWTELSERDLSQTKSFLLNNLFVFNVKSIHPFSDQKKNK